MDFLWLSPIESHFLPSRSSNSFEGRSSDLENFISESSDTKLLQCNQNEVNGHIRWATSWADMFYAQKSFAKVSIFKFKFEERKADNKPCAWKGSPFHFRGALSTAEWVISPILAGTSVSIIARENSIVHLFIIDFFSSNRLVLLH